MALSLSVMPGRREVGVSKDMYIEAHEKLCEELEREPTDEEVEEKVIDMIATIADMGKDIRKYGE